MTAMPSPATNPRFGAGGPVATPTPGAPASGKDTKGKKAAPAGDAKPKKKKLPMIIGLVVLLALVGLKEKGMFIKPHYAPGHPAPDGAVYTLANTSPFTVTTADNHLVQTNVALQLTTVANTKKLATEEPAIENAVITVLGASTSTELIQPAGRAEAAGEILSAVQKLLGPVDGSPQVVKVYFTGSFVVQ